jgi:hypothetical protein
LLPSGFAVSVVVKNLEDMARLPTTYAARSSCSSIGDAYRLKTTLGQFPMWPAQRDSLLFSHAGPLASCVHDAAFCLGVTEGTTSATRSRGSRTVLAGGAAAHTFEQFG